MTKKIDIDVYIAMNEGGDWEIGTDASDTAAALIDNAGGVQMRTVKVTIKMAAPIDETEIEDGARMRSRRPARRCSRRRLASQGSGRTTRPVSAELHTLRRGE